MLVHEVGDLLVSDRRRVLDRLIERSHHLTVARDVLGVQQLARRRVLHVTSFIAHTELHAA